MSESDEMNTDRYVLEIAGDRVLVIDTGTAENGKRVKRVFTGAARLIIGTRYLERLNTEPSPPLAAPEPVAATEAQLRATPEAFLAGLPAYTRQQRLNAMLGEVEEIERRYVALLADDARLLRQASELRARLQKALLRPLSSTLPGQNASGVGEVGSDGLEPQNGSERVGSWVRPKGALRIAPSGRRYWHSY